MIIGLGSDLIDIRRVEKSLERFGDRFVQRVFTEIEQACGHDAVNKAVKASIKDARVLALEAEDMVRSAVWKEVLSQAVSVKIGEV